MAFINDIIALQIIRLLVQPFNKSKAYVLGVIDENGKLLKDPKHFTKEESDSYDALNRIIFKLKRLLEKLPGGKSKVAAIAAAYWLVKEERVCHYSDEWIEETFEGLLNITFVEEYILVEQVMQEDGFAGQGTDSGAGGLPGASGQSLERTAGNKTGRNVSTDQPVVRKKDKKKYFNLVRRGTPKNTYRDNEPVPSVSSLGVSV